MDSGTYFQKLSGKIFHIWLILYFNDVIKHIIWYKKHRIIVLVTFENHVLVIIRRFSFIFYQNTSDIKFSSNWCWMKMMWKCSFITAIMTKNTSCTYFLLCFYMVNTVLGSIYLFVLCVRVNYKKWEFKYSLTFTLTKRAKLTPKTAIIG